jgi:D-glycero-alpha-D-manno-heptose-7-phosphate kinase
MCAKESLAEEAIYVEQKLIGETVGAQDQVFAAFGGLNRIEFRKDDTFRVERVTVSRGRLEQLNGSLMLFYTGLRRTASEVASTYVADIGARHRQLSRMREMVDEGVSILSGSGPLDSFGDLLHEGWTLKRSLSGAVSNPQVDEIYKAARQAGARGGKLLGAGGGGFILFYGPAECHERVRQALKHLIWVPFDFDTGGSQVIFYSPEQDYAALDALRRQHPAQAFEEAAAVPPTHFQS